MSPDHLSATFAALADPTRRAILARLSTGEATVTDLAEPFEMSMPAISKHLKVLERAGLVARSREAQWRPCRIEAAPLKDVAEWVETYRGIWEQRLDRLDAYLRELQAKEKKHGRKPRKGYAPQPIRPIASSSFARVFERRDVVFTVWTDSAPSDWGTRRLDDSRNRWASRRRVALRHARPRRRWTTRTASSSSRSIDPGAWSISTPGRKATSRSASR